MSDKKQEIDSAEPKQSPYIYRSFLWAVGERKKWEGRDRRRIKREYNRFMR